MLKDYLLLISDPVKLTTKITITKGPPAPEMVQGERCCQRKETQENRPGSKGMPRAWAPGALPVGTAGPVPGTGKKVDLSHTPPRVLPSRLPFSACAAWFWSTSSCGSSRKPITMLDMVALPFPILRKASSGWLLWSWSWHKVSSASFVPRYLLL